MMILASDRSKAISDAVEAYMLWELYRAALQGFCSNSAYADSPDGFSPAAMRQAKAALKVWKEATLV